MDSLVSIIRENKIHRFASELQHTTDPIRKHIIQYILSNNLEKKTSNDEMNDYLKKVEKIQYQKEFNKLKPFQRENRIYSFISTTYKTDEKTTQKLTEQLLKLLTDNQLKLSDIHYDSTKGIINNIDKINIIENSFVITKITNTNNNDNEESDVQLFKKVNKNTKTNESKKNKQK